MKRSVLCALVLALSASACGQQAPAAPTPNLEATVQAQIRATMAAAAEPVPTSQPGPVAATPASVVAPTATLNPNVGTHTAPVPFGSTFTLHKGGRTFDLSVTAVERNASHTIVSRPTEGTDYILARLRLRYLSGPENKP